MSFLTSLNNVCRNATHQELSPYQYGALQFAGMNSGLSFGSSQVAGFGGMFGSGMNDLFSGMFGSQGSSFNSLFSGNALETYQKFIQANSLPAPGISSILPAGAGQPAGVPPAGQAGGVGGGARAGGTNVNASSETEEKREISGETQENALIAMDKMGYGEKEAQAILDRMIESADGSTSEFDSMLETLPPKKITDAEGNRTDNENWGMEFGIWFMDSIHGKSETDAEDYVHGVACDAQPTFTKPSSTNGDTPYITMGDMVRKETITVGGESVEARVYKATNNNGQTGIATGTELYRIGNNVNSAKWYMKVNGEFIEIPFLRKSTGGGRYYIEQSATPNDYVMLTPAGTQNGDNNEVYDAYKISQTGEGHTVHNQGDMLFERDGEWFTRNDDGTFVKLDDKPEFNDTTGRLTFGDEPMYVCEYTARQDARPYMRLLDGGIEALDSTQEAFESASSEQAEAQVDAVASNLNDFGNGLLEAKAVEDGEDGWKLEIKCDEDNLVALARLINEEGNADRLNGILRELDGELVSFNGEMVLSPNNPAGSIQGMLPEKAVINSAIDMQADDVTVDNLQQRIDDEIEDDVEGTYKPYQMNVSMIQLGSDFSISNAKLENIVAGLVEDNTYEGSGDVMMGFGFYEDGAQDPSRVVVVYRNSSGDTREVTEQKIRDYYAQYFHVDSNSIECVPLSPSSTTGGGTPAAGDVDGDTSTTEDAAYSVGDVVYFRWSDGSKYKGTISGINGDQYTVTFTDVDGETTNYTVARSDIEPVTNTSILSDSGDLRIRELIDLRHVTSVSQIEAGMAHIINQEGEGNSELNSIQFDIVRIRDGVATNDDLVGLAERLTKEFTDDGIGKFGFAVYDGSELQRLVVITPELPAGKTEEQVKDSICRIFNRDYGWSLTPDMIDIVLESEYAPPSETTAALESAEAPIISPAPTPAPAPAPAAPVSATPTDIPIATPTFSSSSTEPVHGSDAPQADEPAPVAEATPFNADQVTLEGGIDTSVSNWDNVLASRIAKGILDSGSFKQREADGENISAMTVDVTIPNNPSDFGGHVDLIEQKILYYINTYYDADIDVGSVSINFTQSAQAEAQETTVASNDQAQEATYSAPGSVLEIDESEDGLVIEASVSESVAAEQADTADATDSIVAQAQAVVDELSSTLGLTAELSPDGTRLNIICEGDAKGQLKSNLLSEHKDERYDNMTFRQYLNGVLGELPGATDVFFNGQELSVSNPAGTMYGILVTEHYTADSTAPTSDADQEHVSRGDVTAEAPAAPMSTGITDGMAIRTTREGTDAQADRTTAADDRSEVVDDRGASERTSASENQESDEIAEQLSAGIDGILAGFGDYLGGDFLGRGAGISGAEERVSRTAEEGPAVSITTYNASDVEETTEPEVEVTPEPEVVAEPEAEVTSEPVEVAQPEPTPEPEVAAEPEAVEEEEEITEVAAVATEPVVEEEVVEEVDVLADLQAKVDAIPHAGNMDEVNDMQGLFKYLEDIQNLRFEIMGAELGDDGSMLLAELAECEDALYARKDYLLAQSSQAEEVEEVSADQEEVAIADQTSEPDVDNQDTQDASSIHVTYEVEDNMMTVKIEGHAEIREPRNMADVRRMIDQIGRGFISGSSIIGNIELLIKIDQDTGYIEELQIVDEYADWDFDSSAYYNLACAVVRGVRFPSNLPTNKIKIPLNLSA